MAAESDCCKTSEVGKEVVSLTDIPKDLLNCIDSIIKKEGFITHDVKTKKVSTEGGNYLAVLFEIDIKGKTNNDEKEVNIFVKKVTSANKDFTGFISISDVYAIECYVYKELDNIFKNLQDKANVPEEDKFKFVKSYKETTEQLIILENVAKQGFVTFDRMTVIPLKFAELSIIQMAKLHALGFAIKKEIPEHFNNRISKLEYPIQFNEAWRYFINSLINNSIKSLSGNAKIKAEKFRELIFEKYARYYQNKSSILTLCHGDFRANNILMKEKDGVVTDIIVIDYQAIHYGCPINDFLYFIYGCTDREFRKQNMKNLLNLYYNTLTRFLKYFDIDVQEVYPRKVFEASIKERRDLGLCIALMFYPFFFATEDNVPDIAEGVDKVDVTLHPKIARRIEEFVEDLEELGML